MEPPHRIYKALTELRVVLTTALIVIVGGLLLVMAETIAFIADRLWLKSVFSNLGGVLVAAAVVSVLWEFLGKRAFYDEIHHRMGLMADVKAAQLKGVFGGYLEVPWGELLANTKEFDAFFMYGGTWRNAYTDALRNLVRKRGSRIRIALPNYRDEFLLGACADRLHSAGADRDARKVLARARIVETEAFFRDLAEEARRNESTVDVFLVNVVPLYSYYRFDKLGVATFLPHVERTTMMPTLTFQSGGRMFDFFERDFAKIVSTAQ